jgi:hypothetical protein
MSTHVDITIRLNVTLTEEQMARYESMKKSVPETSLEELIAEESSVWWDQVEYGVDYIEAQIIE